MADKNDPRITSATYLETLLDFSDPGDMGALIDETYIRLVEKQMEEKGYLDGGVMSMTFNALRANDLIWSYFIKNYLLGEEPFPFDMLYWNADATNMPAKMHSTYLRSMYLNNLLIKPDGIKIGGVPINLRKIKTPVFFLSTQYDHIAPWKSTYLGIDLHSGPVTFVLGGSGHVAGVVNPPYKNKYNYYLNDHLTKDPDEWLQAAESFPGSWWPYWEKWLRQYSDKLVKARCVKDGRLPILEDSPGSYVKTTLTEVSAKEELAVMEK
jgi:polyhydroxyalkanoate synthase subunit PhaC